MFKTCSIFSFPYQSIINVLISQSEHVQCSNFPIRTCLMFSLPYQNMFNVLTIFHILSCLIFSLPSTCSIFLFLYLNMLKMFSKLSYYKYRNMFNVLISLSEHVQCSYFLIISFFMFSCSHFPKGLNMLNSKIGFRAVGK